MAPRIDRVAAAAARAAERAAGRVGGQSAGVVGEALRETAAVERAAARVGGGGAAAGREAERVAAAVERDSSRVGGASAGRQAERDAAVISRQAERVGAQASPTVTPMKSSGSMGVVRAPDMSPPSRSYMDMTGGSQASSYFNTAEKTRTAPVNTGSGPVHLGGGIYEDPRIPSSGNPGFSGGSGVTPGNQARTPHTAPVSSASAGGWRGALGAAGKGISSFAFGEDSVLGKTAFRNMMLGGGAGAVGGAAYGAGSVFDGNTFQSNGIVKPMLQGAWKGALLTATHAAAGGLTKAEFAGKYANISKGAKMVQKASDHTLTKGALMMASFGGGGDSRFTKASNPIK